MSGENSPISYACLREKESHCNEAFRGLSLSSKPVSLKVSLRARSSRVKGVQAVVRRLGPSGGPARGQPDTLFGVGLKLTIS